MENKHSWMRTAVPLALLSATVMLSGCAVSANANGSSPSPSVAAVEPVFNLTPGGSFADQPDLAGGPMTIDQAISGAIAGTETVDPQTDVEVITYQEFHDTYMNGSANQLAPESSVIVVHVLAPFPAEDLTMPPGAEPGADWPTYIVASDPRTGLALAVMPGGDL